MRSLREIEAPPVVPVGEGLGWVTPSPPVPEGEADLRRPSRGRFPRVVGSRPALVEPAGRICAWSGSDSFPDLGAVWGDVEAIAETMGALTETTQLDAPTTRAGSVPRTSSTRTRSGSPQDLRVRELRGPAGMCESSDFGFRGDSGSLGATGRGF